MARVEAVLATVGRDQPIFSTAQELQQQLRALLAQYTALFAWYDGPLVQAMRNGDMLLIDEISLADDAVCIPREFFQHYELLHCKNQLLLHGVFKVLERLNSVLEPHRLLVLAEKGGAEVEEITAHPNFLVLATMNPGGDFGKKELSPAMRNRFTEIWVPAISSGQDLVQIIEEKFASPVLRGFSAHILSFVEWFQSLRSVRRVISLRDILSWVSFLNAVVPARNGELMFFFFPSTMRLSKGSAQNTRRTFMARASYCWTVWVSVALPRKRRKLSARKRSVSFSVCPADVQYPLPGGGGALADSFRANPFLCPRAALLAAVPRR
jgi:glutathione S-transferase